MLFEVFVVFTLLVLGMCLARALQIQDRIYAICAGVVLVVGLRVVTFSIFNLIELPQLANAVFYATAIALAITLNFKRKFQSVLSAKDALWSALAAVVCVAPTRLLGMRPLSHGDSLYILGMAQHFASGKSVAGFDTPMALKRGFAYPVMLGLGEPGSYLSSVTFLIFLATGIFAIKLAHELSKQFDLKKKLILGGLLIAAIFSTSMGLLLTIYINGHVLTALGILVGISVVLQSTQNQRFTTSNFVLFACSQLVVSTSRPEGFLVALLLAIPLLVSTFLGRAQMAALMAVPPLAFIGWLIVFKSYLLASLPVSAFVVLLIVAAISVLFATPWLDFVRRRITTIAIFVFVAALATATVFWFQSLSIGYAALWANLIFGYGRWGFLFVGLIIIWASLIAFKVKDLEVKLLSTFCVLFIIGSMTFKMLDGGQFGNPTLGRVGWSDSLNRMWSHYVLVFVLMVFLGSLKRIEPASKFTPVNLQSR